MTRSTHLLLLLLTPALMPLSFASPLFINEFHYDNAGTDTNEGVELVSAAGTSLDGYQILLYNGTNGSVYSEINLQGTIQDQQSGFGTVFFDISGIQNGPDGIALTDANGSVLQFLSYEGSFTASNGAAKGMTSVDIGVFEDSSASPDTSLQLTGSGDTADTFSWVTGIASRGSINAQQQFIAPVPLPTTLWLFVSALYGLIICRKKPTPNGVGSIGHA